MAERLYNTHQVADLLGVNPTAVVEWMQKGWLPFQRLPAGGVRVSEKGLVTFLKNQGIDIESVMAKAVVRQEHYKQVGQESVDENAGVSHDEQKLLEAPMPPNPVAETPAQKHIDPPAEEEPAAQEPVVEESIAEEPVVEEPTAQEPPTEIAEKDTAELTAVPAEKPAVETPAFVPPAFDPPAEPEPEPTVDEEELIPAPAEPESEPVSETPSEPESEPTVEPEPEPTVEEPAVEPEPEPAVEEPAPVAAEVEADFAPIETTSPEQVAQVAQAVLKDAVARRASHIHLDLQGQAFSLRLRIDGILHDKPLFSSHLSLPAAEKLIEELTSRAGIDAASPTGRIVEQINDTQIAFDVSRVPLIAGEKILLTIRDPRIAWSLSTLNLLADEQKTVDALLAAPCGLVVVAGMPKAGIEYALWSMVGQIDRSQRSVVWIGGQPDDRIGEVASSKPIAGENASAVVEQFAAADSDVIVIERLDSTATIRAALSAADTGCLVLAGIRADNAPTALARILASEPDPWPLAETFLAAIAVRTLRKLCDECKTQAEPAEDLLRKLELKPEDLASETFQPGRCDACGRTGYRGMTAAISLLANTPAVADLLRREAPADALIEAALHSGGQTLRQAALEKVRAGQTTLAELLRTRC